MSGSRPALTLLYAPADRPDRVQKAYVSDADAVIIDLEDAVAPAGKDDSRGVVPGLLAVLLAPHRQQARRPSLQLRINAVGSPWHVDDVAMAAGLPSQVAVRLPKAESVTAVRRLCDTLGGRRVHLLLESARGVERAYELATCHDAIAGVSLGEADLKAELGVTSEEGLLWARSRVVVAAAAAGLPAPSMAAYTDVRDADGLAESCRRGRAMGFVGRTAIHPRQLEVIRTAFLPTPDEVTKAREVVDAADAAAAAGSGAVALADGRFVDEAVVRQARRTLALAEG